VGNVKYLEKGIPERATGSGILVDNLGENEHASSGTNRVKVLQENGGEKKTV